MAKQGEWRRRAVRGAVEALIIAGVVAACGGAADSPSTTASTTVIQTTTTSTATTTTTEAPTTTRTEATTTTTGLEMTPELAVVAFILGVENTRDDFIDILEADINVQSVDRLEASADDPDDALSVRLIVDITSAWSGEEFQADGAWELTRAIANFWRPNGGPWYSDVWVPAFTFVNSGRTYDCSGEFMVKIADARASRSQWEEECG